MSRPTIDACWKYEIRNLALADHSLGAEAIHADLEQKKKDGTLRGEVPSLRTVHRYVRKFRDLPEKEQRPHRLFSWPEAMLGAASLPWEASQAGLELLRYCREEDLGKPRIKHVEWFWRVTQAAPDVPLDRRAELAGALALLEVAEEKSPGKPRTSAGEIVARHLENIQWELTCQGDMQAYDRHAEDLRKGGEAGDTLVSPAATWEQLVTDAPQSLLATQGLMRWSSKGTEARKEGTRKATDRMLEITKELKELEAKRD